MCDPYRGQREGKVEVFTYVGDEMVFQGNFVIYRSAGETVIEGGDEDADRD